MEIISFSDEEMDFLDIVLEKYREKRRLESLEINRNIKIDKILGE